MKSNLPLALALTILASCATPEMDAAKGAEICKKSGLSEESPGFADCIGEQVAKLEEARAEFGAALAVGLQTYGESQQRYYAQPRTSYYAPPPPSYTPQFYTPPARLRASCTSMQTQPGMVMTNCY